MTVNHSLDVLCRRIDRLEADLAAATLETLRARNALKRRRAVYTAVVVGCAVIISASWTLRAQTPARMPGTPEEQILSLLQRVTALEQRAAALERRSTNRVKAPFEVVDDAGRIVFNVEAAGSRSFQLWTAGGKAVAVGSALDTGGFFKALSPDQSRSVVVGVNGSVFTGVVSRQGEKPRASLGIGADGKAFMDIATESAIVGHFGQGAAGGGLLQLANPGGNAQVEAGVLASGAGIVRTFPNGNPGAGLVGMPGTFIMGRPGAQN